MADGKDRERPGHEVMSVSRENGGVRVEGTGSAGAWRLDAGEVVNALWENRRAIDATIGLDSEPGWLHRLKYRIIVRLPAGLADGPSATMVLGRYGDVVIRPGGTAYLSWYPLALRGWTQDLAAPPSWQPSCRGDLDADQRRPIALDTMAAIDTWYPGIAKCEPPTVDAGVIVAYGRTDVDDAGSRLHDRAQVGVSSHDGYHSVDPGKLTTAPLFARLAAERVLGAA